MEGKIIQTTCPFCGNITYTREGMTNAYCITCGHELSPKNTSEVTDDIKKMCRVTLSCYLSCNCAHISIDNRNCVIVNDRMKSSEFELEKGTHNVTIGRFWRAGVISDTDVLKLTMNVDEDGDYIIQVNKNKKILEIIRKESEEKIVNPKSEKKKILRAEFDEKK